MVESRMHNNIAKVVEITVGNDMHLFIFIPSFLFCIYISVYITEGRGVSLTASHAVTDMSKQQGPLVFGFCQETELRACQAPIHEKTQVAPYYGLISLCTQWTLLQGLGIGYLMDPNMTS